MVDIGFLGVTISHVTLWCSQYFYNSILDSYHNTQIPFFSHLDTIPAQ